MANRIKGITVEIGGDTTGLDKALKSVNTSIRSTQSALKDVNRLLKLDPSNTELLSQKQRLLKDAIAATKEKLDSLKVAQEQAKQQLENGTYIKATVSYSFASCSSKNTVTRATYYRVAGTSTWTNASASFNSGTAFAFGGGKISTETSYEVKYELTDAFTTISIYHMREHVCVLQTTFLDLCNHFR